jgi:hypothetical protein
VVSISEEREEGVAAVDENISKSVPQMEIEIHDGENNSHHYEEAKNGSTSVAAGGSYGGIVARVHAEVRIGNGVAELRRN